MKRFILFFLLGCQAFAQIPDAPSAAKKQNVYIAPLKQPEFYISVGAFSSSAIYDVHSTRVCEANKTCVEAYKGHDRYGYYTPLVGLVVAGTYGCQLMLNEHKWWRRFACSGIGIGLSIQHWKDGSAIYYEPREARP